MVLVSLSFSFRFLRSCLASPFVVLMLSSVYLVSFVHSSS